MDYEVQVVCESHGVQSITESGSVPGFTGAYIHWCNLACGCQLVDDSADDIEAAR